MRLFPINKILVGVAPVGVIILVGLMVAVVVCVGRIVVGETVGETSTVLQAANSTPTNDMTNTCKIPFKQFNMCLLLLEWVLSKKVR